MALSHHNHQSFQSLTPFITHIACHAESEPLVTDSLTSLQSGKGASVCGSTITPGNRFEKAVTFDLEFCLGLAERGQCVKVEGGQSGTKYHSGPHGEVPCE